MPADIFDAGIPGPMLTEALAAGLEEPDVLEAWAKYDKYARSRSDFATYGHRMSDWRQNIKWAQERVLNRTKAISDEVRELRRQQLLLEAAREAAEEDYSKHAVTYDAYCEGLPEEAPQRLHRALHDEIGPLEALWAYAESKARGGAPRSRDVAIVNQGGYVVRRRGS